MIVGGYVVPWEDEDKKYLKLLWSNICALVANFLDNSVTPIVDYVVSPHNLHYIKELQHTYDVRIKYVVLMADEQTLIARDAQREPDCVMGQRVVELLHKFKERNIDPKFILDTSYMTIEEVVEEVVTKDRFLI